MSLDDVRHKKVLMVGAGGIGCELLKTLVLTGFTNIEMVDMDTIETSNLNRQFLFRKRHVGQSKAQVARESVLRFRPDAKIVAHFDNVKSAPFDVSFFRTFDVVLNGLDNLDARRHVNRRCLAAEVPLVESGTAGYLGQVSVHLKGVSQCFECEPKPVPKTFPVCTIRNTPDKPIHCIVWAKDMLFATLFGPKAASELEEQEDEPAANADEDDETRLTKETAEERAERAAFFQRKPDEPAVTFAARIFGRAYGSDIHRLLRMSTLWEKPGRKAPTPLAPTTDAVNAHIAGLVTADTADASACASLGLKDPNALWTVDEATSVFLLSCARLAERQRACDGAPLSFDKDDALACELVAAAALLRGSNYGIPGQSLFAAKGMAGNIIHAIATTNAIISGLIVMQAVSVLRGQRTGLLNVYLAQLPSHTRRGSRLLMPEAVEAPNPGCFVCCRQRMHVSLDLTTWTVGALVERILIPRFAMQQPVLMAGNGFYFEHATDDLEDDELAHNAMLRGKTLANIPGGGLKDGDVVELLDGANSLKFEIQLVHCTTWDVATEADGFMVQGELKAQAAAAVATAAPAPDDDDDGFIIVDDDTPPQPADEKGKRKRGDDTEAQGKKAKTAAEVITL